MSPFAGKLFRGAVVLSGTQAVGQVCSLGRNVIVARVLSPADFGVAAIFLMTVNLLDMISNMSLDRLLVQAEDGDDEVFQQTAHGLNLLRGFVSAILLVLLAYPLASLFNIPDATHAFVLLGLVPLLIGFSHLDPKRVERHMRFWPHASVEVISQVVLLAAAWPLSQYFQDYRAMLWLLILRSIVMLIGSHSVSERSYRLAWNKEYLNRFIQFGWPLLLNGILLFLVLQGDRFLIGSAKQMFNSNYGMEDVGIYSAAFLLAMVPGQMLARVGTSLFLPGLSREQGEPKTFNLLYRKYLASFVLLGVMFGSVFVLTGEQVVALVYGDAYSEAGVLMGCLGLMWVIRILRVVPTLFSMAQGQTKNLLSSNIVRSSVLFIVLCLLVFEADLFWVALTGAAGELIALVVMVAINNKAFPAFRPKNADLLFVGFAGLVLAVAVMETKVLPVGLISGIVTGFVVSTVLTITCAGVIYNFLGVWLVKNS